MPEQYYIKLCKANMLESKKPADCLFFLQECVEIIQNDENLAGSHPFDVKNLQQRIRHLKNMKITQSDAYASEIAPNEINLDDNTEEMIRSETSATLEVKDYSDEMHPIVQTTSFISESVSDPESVIQSDILIQPVFPIVQTLYDKLMEDQYPSYDDYLEFFRSINLANTNLGSPILKEEGSLVYYIGDTHGSYKESQIMINYFKEVIDKRPNVKIVFVGDYVDRNPFDLENLTLITAFTFLYPSNVIMLRGNHEDYQINRNYGFIQNLTDAFIIQDQVELLYSEILTYFTHLPLVHIYALRNDLNGTPIRIVANHGGIPINLQNPEIPVVLDEIASQLNSTAKSYTEYDKYMNWLLWADPKENITDFLVDPTTGRNEFGIDAFSRYMKANNFGFMVRAHEKWPSGYKFFFNNALVSLFSTSFYNNRKIGEAAFIRLEQGVAPKILSPLPEILDQDLNSTFLNES